MHLAIAAGFHFHDLFHPLRYWGYQFWSGIGSDLGELTLVGILYAGWRHVNCHSPWCLRVGRHPTADGKYKLCRRHHPDVSNHLSLAEIHEDHRAAQDSPS